MIKINFFVGSKFLVNRKFLRQSISQIIIEHKLDNLELDVLIVGRRKIRQLNEAKLGHRGETDVLSFPLYQNKQEINADPLGKLARRHLGSIVVCYPVAVDTARRFGKLVDERIAFYLQHGLMHLLGYHHL